MNILIYGEYFIPSIGGVQTAMEQLARGLAQFHDADHSDGSGSFEVTVATNTPQAQMDDSKLSYRVVRKPKFWELARLVRKADLVHLAGPCLLPMLMGCVVGKPYVVVHHGYQAVCPNGLLLKLPLQAVCTGHFMNGEYAECFRCSSQSIGAMGGMRSLLLQFPRWWLCKRAAANVMITTHVGARLQLPRSRTIYYGIDDVKMEGGQSDPNRSGPMEFGYVGRLVAEKGLPLLLEAARHLANSGRVFRLTFIGDGPERARLEALVRNYGLGERVEFMGDMRGAAFEWAAGRIAVVIMPSIWEETAGLAAIEQMMRGRLVIAADIGGLGEVVGDAGMKFVPGDWHSLAAWMGRVIDDPSLVTSFGSAARARANKLFRRDTMIESQIAICREVAHG
jgi:glycosyltransferase involved in cell wall biosynthesis